MSGWERKRGAGDRHVTEWSGLALGRRHRHLFGGVHVPEVRPGRDRARARREGAPGWASRLSICSAARIMAGWKSTARPAKAARSPSSCPFGTADAGRAPR